MQSYQAVFFDWDGTAVTSRNADASGVLKAMTAAMQKGIRLVIISGTTYENICDGKLGKLISADLLDHLFLGLGRGNYNYGFDPAGSPKLLVDRTPNPDDRVRLHDAVYALHKFLLERFCLPTDIVFTRPNYCKIDIMADSHRDPEALFLQADEVKRVNEILAKHKLTGGLAELIKLAEDIGSAHGLTLKATTDAKYLEVGYTTKTDNVNGFMNQMTEFGIDASKCCFWGDEFGAISPGVWGSDQQMITELTEKSDFFSVSKVALPLPEQVKDLGGGPDRFIQFLTELAE